MSNASEIKEKILRIIKQAGPSLPVKIASSLEISPLFASAFLSELLSEKKLKISHLRVGNSPVYFIPGQEPKLENFSEHLKSKEREAFLLLQEKKFLVDEKQHPAIRVALRAIRDFAFTFRKDDKIIWRYFIVPESEFIEEKNKAKEIEKIGENSETSDISEEIVEDNTEFLEGEEKIREKILPEEKKETITKKVVRKKTAKKKNDKFFNQVKEFLLERSIEIADIEGVSQGDLILRVNENGEEKLIVAYNKKRIGEMEIIKANKKAVELGLHYTILSLGGPLKKLTSLIDAIRNLSDIEKL